MATSPDKPGPSDDLQPEYDFRSMRGVVRGKYAARYQERLRVVRLTPFPSYNSLLRNRPGITSRFHPGNVG